jgi:hypothetical protein
MSYVDDFRPVLGRIDAKVFGEKSTVCITNSDLAPLSVSEGPIIYCPSIDFIRMQWTVQTDYLMPDRNFFLLHRTLFDERVKHAVLSRSEGEILLPEYFIEVALNRVWRKFQIRRLKRLPRGAICPIPAEVVERCCEIEGFDREEYHAVIDDERVIQWAARCGRGEPDGPALQRDTQLAGEYLAIGTLAKLHYALSEDAAIRFLRRLMMAVAPGTISRKRGMT